MEGAVRSGYLARRGGHAPRRAPRVHFCCRISHNKTNAYCLGDCPALCSLPFLAIAEDTRLTVQVTSADTGKPIDRASVIVKFRHGLNVNMRKILTNWETKTNQHGKVTHAAHAAG